MRVGYTPGAYDVCITCTKRPQYCNGPRTTGLTPERRVEFSRSLKEHEGWTIKDIADELEIAERTVDNYFAGKNVQLFTACAIEDLLFGSSGTYPCPLEAVAEAMEELKAAQTEIIDLKAEIGRLDEERSLLRDTQGGIHTSYREELDAVRLSYRREIDSVWDKAVAEIKAVRADAEKRVGQLQDEIAFLRDILSRALEK